MAALGIELCVHRLIAAQKPTDFAQGSITNPYHSQPLAINGAKLTIWTEGALPLL
jgi:hypothetical protein